MDDFDITYYAQLVMKRLRLVVLLSVIAALVVAIALRFIPQTYRGRAVLIFPRTEQAASGLLSRLAGVSGMSDLGMGSGNGPGMYAEILRSRTISKQVCDDLQLSKAGIEPEKLQKDIHVVMSKDGGMEICCFASTDWAEKGKLDWLDERAGSQGTGKRTALLASEITNTYIKRLQDFNRRHSLSTGHRNKVFLEGEVAKTKSDLSEAEEKLRKFKETHPVVPPPETAVQQVEQVVTVRTKQIEAETELEETDRSIDEAKGIIDDQELIQTASTVVHENPIVTQLKAQLAESEVKRAALLEDRSDIHPDVVAASEEIAKIQERIRQEVEKVTASETLQINPVRQALVQDLAVMEIKKSGVQARIDALNGIMTRMERDIADVAKDQMQYVRLMRDVTALEIVYTSLLTELSQAKVAEAREPNGFTVLDWATPEKRHIKPRAKLTIAAGLLLGFIFGSLVAILLESKHPTKRRTV